MTTQPEQILEDNLVNQLVELGYEYVHITGEEDLKANLKKQLETHNKTTFTDTEFDRILNHLNKGSVFQKADILRDHMNLHKDNGDKKYIEFLQQEHWCQNHFQVTRQVTMTGKYRNRYDVTILINGLPLVQIELKRRGLELKEAFNQINRYQRHSYWGGSALFQYIQIFVISNGVNTKYYANNREQTFKQTFFWCDIDNTAITQLDAFTRQFLEPCHISKMIAKYIVLHQSDKKLMVLRSYQYHAVEALLDRIANSRKNGYIWHTTGSGKTLTSFKAGQVLMRNPKIDKVVFVVDRKDLDFHTQKEFNEFCPGSVDASENTRMLIRQFNSVTKLILTTIQKLDNAVKKDHYKNKMEVFRDQEIIFIFDECHRSQFGETHRRIKEFFTRARMFGFTGTPIFAENAVSNDMGKRTTKELFHQCLHKYVITDAIRDDNVLKFAVEYIGKYRYKDGSKAELDIEVEDIDKTELLESTDRLAKITDYIIANHARKTHNGDFTAMFCVSSVPMLIKYYELFKQRKAEGAHQLKVAAIYHPNQNEEDRDADGFDGFDGFGDFDGLGDSGGTFGFNDDPGLLKVAQPSAHYHTPPDSDPADNSADNIIPFTRSLHSLDQLQIIIDDYNRMFTEKFSGKDNKGFYKYYNNIAKRVKNRGIDILLVVDMFLTGFDSKYLNTLYVDKNLRYHGLVQAFSRTNRILDEKKSHGNIVCFRNLKKAADDAIALFADKNAEEIIIMEPYETYVDRFAEAVTNLTAITPTVDSVNALRDEDQELEFVKAFRELMRLKNRLTTFVDFDWQDLAMSEQQFNDYKSKYLDLYEKVKGGLGKEKESILNDVDFQLELIRRDEINVAYILRLLAELREAPESNREAGKKRIIELISGEVKLRSKRELIERFIEESLMFIADVDDIPGRFNEFWTIEKDRAFAAMCEEENLSPEKCRVLLERYLYTGQEPRQNEILAMYEGGTPPVLQRKALIDRLFSRVTDFVETFINGMDI